MKRPIRFRNNTDKMSVVHVDPNRAFHMVSVKGGGTTQKVGVGTYTHIDGNVLVRDRAVVAVCADDCPVVDKAITASVTYSGPQFIADPTDPNKVDPLRQAIVDAFGNALAYYDSCIADGIPPNFSDIANVDYTAALS